MNVEHHFIGGELVRASAPAALEVHASHTEEIVARTPRGTAEEAERAVLAASRAFEGWSRTPVAERARLIVALGDALAAREEDLATAITHEVGMPRKLSKRIQVGLPVRTMRAAVDLVAELERRETSGNSQIVHEPVGVVACITPWNYPLHQITAKIAPALLAGNTVVVKPSEVAPMSAFMLAEGAIRVGFPPGVLNVVFGEGPVVGEALASSELVDMVSFTGSTRAGRRVAELGARSIKRIALELGGKSPSVVLDDANLVEAVRSTVSGCFLNSGQTCSATTRLLVPRGRYDEAVEMARVAAEAFVVGDPFEAGTRLGPLASAAQRKRVRDYIALGVTEGARIATGGVEPPAGLERGYYVRPTVFADVAPSMRIAQEEIFGPVLCVIAHDGDEDAIRIANGTIYGLAAAVHSTDHDRALRVARRIRSGQVDIGDAPYNPSAPFGGMKQSGVGREYGVHGLHEFTEIKAIQFPT